MSVSASAPDTNTTGNSLGSAATPAARMTDVPTERVATLPRAPAIPPMATRDRRRVLAR